MYVNYPKPKTLVRVSILNGATDISSVRDTGDLNAVLADIGARNSDLLLSDAVLFVEGPGDERLLRIWARLLDVDFDALGVTVLDMNGGEFAGWQAPSRSDVLRNVSSNACRIPHLFVLDRDERTEEEMSDLERDLAGHVHILQRREIENYLLVPRAIRAAFIGKYGESSPQGLRFRGLNDQRLQGLLSRAADDLKGLVVVKRIRHRLGTLKQGFVSRELAAELEPEAFHHDLAQRIRTAVDSRIEVELDLARLKTIVREERAALNLTWTTAASRLAQAPGADVLERACDRLREEGTNGIRFDKSKDAIRIANAMTRDEIPEEISQLVTRIAGLRGV